MLFSIGSIVLFGSTLTTTYGRPIIETCGKYCFAVFLLQLVVSQYIFRQAPQFCAPDFDSFRRLSMRRRTMLCLLPHFVFSRSRFNGQGICRHWPKSRRSVRKSTRDLVGGQKKGNNQQDPTNKQPWRLLLLLLRLSANTRSTQSSNQLSYWHMTKGKLQCYKYGNSLF